MISEISKVMKLEVGDLILTGCFSLSIHMIPFFFNLTLFFQGTPSGVGPIAQGDSVEAGLEYHGC